jgi:glycerol-3-phosphate O-acyltransferase/dihydroxyacetone phosphate acyltransferase
MLLYLLYPIIWLGLRIFFRRIDIRGRDQVPLDRPLIFVANHPNVMLDGLILGFSSPGKIPRFLGKSTLFKRRLYAFFLRQLGVIPVSRAQDGGARVGRNQDMLQQACQVLQDGHSLALFPEGLSHAAIKVRKLKPGGARIALRVEDMTAGEAGVHIVPVGLTYADPGLFRSSVAVHFGEAIQVRPFLPAYRANHSAGARELTDVLHQHLTTLTWHIDNPDLETIVRDLAAIYTEQIAADLPDSAALSSELRAGREIIQAVHHFADADPVLVQSFSTRLRAHHRKLRRLGLEPYTFSPQTRPPRLRHLLLAVALAPMALYGFLHNALPYFLPRLFVRPYRQTPEMIGTIKLAVGAAIFPLYYLAWTSIAYLFTGWTTALFYGCSLPLSGFLTLFYQEQILQKWPLWQSLVAPRKRNHYLKRLAAERDLLLRDLDALKQHYLAGLQP